MSALARKMDYLKAKDIHLILTELSQDFYDDKVKEINSELQEETTKLDYEKVEAIRALLKVLVENDEAFAQKVAKIIEENRDNAPQDITFNPKALELKVSNVALAMLLVYGLGNNAIRAVFPNVVKTKEVEIIRGYESNIIPIAISFSDELSKNENNTSK